jgi:hypothetical protein
VGEASSLAAAVGVIVASLIAAGYTIWLGRRRMLADERREFGRWLAEQRLQQFVQAHALQREMVFNVSGTLQNHLGWERSWSGDSAPTYSYARWLALNDELRSVVASLRILGADEVADHLTETLELWWSDDARRLMRDFKPELGPRPQKEYEHWRLSKDGRANQYLNRAERMVELARADVRRLGSTSGLLGEAT